MKRHVLICGFIGGVLITVLRWTECRFLVIEHSVEIYGGFIAAIFAVLGVWPGMKYVVTWDVLYFDSLHGFTDKYAVYVIEKAKASGASPAAIQAQLQESKV